MKLKNHFILTGILFCIILSFGFRVYAEEKQYEISQADFEIELMEDGSADVTEEWTLHYTTGSFTRFYKDIYKDVTRLEQYDDIDFKEFSINGVSCERVYDTLYARQVFWTLFSEMAVLPLTSFCFWYTMFRIFHHPSDQAMHNRVDLLPVAVCTITVAMNR